MTSITAFIVRLIALLAATIATLAIAAGMLGLPATQAQTQTQATLSVSSDGLTTPRQP